MQHKQAPSIVVEYLRHCFLHVGISQSSTHSTVAFQLVCFKQSEQAAGCLTVWKMQSYFKLIYTYTNRLHLHANAITMAGGAC